MPRTLLPRFARLLSPALLSGALLFSGGCAYFAATPPLDIGKDEHQVAKDVPAPEGFVLDRARSHRHERDGYRRFDLTYRRIEYLGEDRVREFIAKTFPAAGWKVRFIWGLNDTHFLLTRGPDECEIHVFEDFGDRYTQMEVSVHPRETPDGVVVSRKSLSSKPLKRAGTKATLPASMKRGK
ncbi:MAG: hypothetical protein JKY65_04455 [Planctomycetes bacterium]|nr:hypothetical protein [Planctomycetota bacterium]